jgi:hypothetical protein
MLTESLTSVKAASEMSRLLSQEQISQVRNSSESVEKELQALIIQLRFVVLSEIS